MKSSCLLLAVSFAEVLFLFSGLAQPDAPSYRGVFMERLPSYTEHTGWYNIVINEHDSVSDTPPFCTTDDLPELSGEEFSAVRQATYQCLYRHGRKPGFSDVEIESFYGYSVGDELVDRTVRLDLPEIELLTPELVCHLQQEVLATYPLWRIFINGSSPGSVVIVYPSSIRTGQGWNADQKNWTNALETTVAIERNLREKLFGAKRRQLDFVHDEIKEQLPAIRKMEPGFTIVAVFDNWRGDKDSLCVWLLSRGVSQGGRRSDYVVVKPTSSRTDFYAVRDDGEFGPHHQPSRSDLWLTEWPIPRDTKQVTIQEIDGRLNPVGQQWQISVKVKFHDFDNPGSAS